MSHKSNAIDPIIEACRAGHQTLLVSGRSLFDLHLNERGEVRPLRHTLMRRVKEDFGMATLLFNLAQGSRWGWDGFSDAERKDFEKRLSAANIPFRHGVEAGADQRNPPHERAFLLLASLQRSLEQADEIPPFLLLLEFGEDLAPDNDRGGHSDLMVQISEMLQILSNDYIRRRHPFLVVMTGTPERMDRRVVTCMTPVAIPQPDREEKRDFIQALRSLPGLATATYEAGLDDQAVANLTARTPNRSLEESFQQSSRTGLSISHAQIIERKRNDVVAISEGTLKLLDTERVRNINLVGRNIERPLALLQRWARGIKLGDPLTPTNVILAGAPSSAKTDLAVLTAMQSQTPAYCLVSPKGSLVGQTERLVRLQFRVFKELSPAFGVVDEITEAFPMERHSLNMDSGASAAVTAEMLNALSDFSRAGRTLLIATTNCPWRVGAAMASRFLFVPVLSAIEADYPAILCSIASSILPEIAWDPSAPEIIEASRMFFAKGATPRLMRALITSKVAAGDEPKSMHLAARAARACAPQDPRDRASSEYADLFAIRACSDLERLPWHGRISEYPLPAYLRGIVGEKDGSIDYDRLHRRIEELKPHVNV